MSNTTAVTIAGLAELLRGIPRTARVVFRAPDGTIYPVRAMSGHNAGSGTYQVGLYTVLLETEDDETWAAREDKMPPGTRG